MGDFLTRKKIVKFLSISICCNSLYLYILYSPIVLLYIPLKRYRVLYIIVLYRYIMRYSDIMVLCCDILWLYALMLLYGIIRTYRAIILCDTVGLWYYIIICVCDAILSYYALIHSSDFLPPFVKVNVIYYSLPQR